MHRDRSESPTLPGFDDDDDNLAARIIAAHRRARAGAETLIARDFEEPPTLLVQRKEPVMLTQRKGPRAGEQRRSPRVSLVAEVDLSSEHNFFTGFSTDLAEGGLFIATLSPLPIGTRVHLKFTVPGHPRLEVNGEVRWLRSLDDRTPATVPGVGVKFLELTPEARAVIAGFVAEREPIFFAD